MKNRFRLLHARLAEIETRPRWRLEASPTPAAAVEISFRTAANDASGLANDSHVSVLLGRNGEGKSRILSGIATTFQLLQDYARSGSPRGVPLASLEYIACGRHHQVTCSGSKILLSIDGNSAPIHEAALPKRVIGLSMTPFDKFPIGGARRPRALSDLQMSDVYSYLGMRERMGQVSTSALLTRALEGMVSRIARDDRGRLTRVFDLLGYLPAVDIVYRLHERSLMEALVEGANLDELLGARHRNTVYSNRLQELLARDEEAVDEAREAARNVLSESRRGFVHLRFDFEQPDFSGLRFYASLQLLRRLGLVRLYAVEVGRKSGGMIDLKEASSGELSIAITFMSLAAALEDDSLILIDEPETNLHPEWQARYLDLLLSTFSSYRNCHYILATHSPLILSDSPQNATLASLSSASLRHGEEVSGRPVDFLLVEAFDVASGDNYYVQEQLVKALRLAADGEARGSEYQNTVRSLVRIRSMIKDNPGVVELIGDLERIAQKVVQK
ncbi:AAA family ATPase [Pelagibacterium lentulum]|nr:AAA family ATPase [Pelagibacterium lentulum]